MADRPQAAIHAPIIHARATSGQATGGIGPITLYRNPWI